MNIEDVFPNGEWKKDDEYCVRCVICGDSPTHDHLYINPNLRVYKCWYCGEGGSLRKLLAEYGDGSKLEPRVGITKKKDYPQIDFSVFKKVTGDSGTMNRLAFGYLRGRGLSKEEIEGYDIRYSESGRYYGRVLFPIYEDGKLMCFSARSFINWIVPKYLFPHTGETVLTTSECVWGIDEIGSKLATIVCEGILDAIAVNRFLSTLGSSQIQAVSILSKNLSRGQLHKLMRLSNIITILLDADAYADAVKIAKQFYAYGIEVMVGRLKHGDPADNSIEEFEKVFGSAKAYNLEMEVSLI